MKGDARVVIGRIVRPHGIRGELIVEAAGDTLARLPAGTPLQVGSERIDLLRQVRPHRERWLVSLSGIEDRDAAEAVRGCEILVGAELVARPTAGDEFLVDELVGCVLVGRSGTEYGTVEAIVPGVPHDLLRVRTPAGESLVPMARDWLVEARVAEGRLVLDLPDGLLEATHSDG